MQILELKQVFIEYFFRKDKNYTKTLNSKNENENEKILKRENTEFFL